MFANNSQFVISRMVVSATVCIAVFAFFAFFAICYLNWPRNSRAGQLIEECGTFRSPHGNGLVTFQSGSDGRGTVTVSANSPARTPSSTMSFARAQSCFGAWDEDDRFWTYIEGVGIHIHDHANGVSRTTYIGKSYVGDGRDIPAEFLQRLREAVNRKDSRSIPPNSGATAA